MSTTTPVIALDHPAALDVARVGRKAADLAAARAAGLPVAPGVVLTTDWATDDEATVAQVWRITSHDGARALVVRPSAVARDRRPGAEHGAVMPATIVRDLDAMVHAVAELRSNDATTPVLVQPHLTGAWQGVLFADGGAPGWRARPLAVARRDGSVGEWAAELDHTGRIRDVVSAEPADGPPAEVLTRVARLAVRVADRFAGPHDVEWVADPAGRLQLLRLRPVVQLRPAPSAGAAAVPPSVRTSRASRSRRRRSSSLEPVFATDRSVDDPAA
jgi:hypothetical protein